MCRMYKVWVVLAIFIGFSAFSFGQDLSNLVNSGDIQFPSDAQEVKMPLKLPTGPGTMNMYKTSLSAEELREFYRQSFTNRGWQSQGTVSQAFRDNNLPTQQQMPDGSMFNLGGVLDNILTFQKGDTMVNLMIMPAGKRGQTETLFGLAVIDMGAKQQIAVDMPRSIPIYPNAEFTGSGARSRSYSVEEDIDVVVSFYKQKMASAGWSIEREYPLEEKSIDIGTSLQGGIGCESCLGGEIPDDVLQELQGLQSLKVLMSKIQFMNNNNERCSLLFNQQVSIEGSKSTQIDINY